MNVKQSILDALQSGQKTVAMMLRDISASRSAIDKALRQMKDEGLIHVADSNASYRRGASNPRLYGIGPGINQAPNVPSVIHPIIAWGIR